MERLHQTHDSLRAFRPPEGAEAILGYPMPEAPPPRGIITPVVSAKPDELTKLAAAELFAYDADIAPQTPLWAPQIAADQEIEAPAPEAGFIPIYGMPPPRWPMDRLVVPEPSALEATGPVWIPLRSTAALMRDVLRAGVAPIPLAPRHYVGARVLEPLHTAMQPCRDVAHEASPAGNALSAKDDVPGIEKLIPLAVFSVRDDRSPKSRREAWPAAPFSNVQRAHLPLAATERGVKQAVAAPPLAGLRSLSIDQVPLVHGTWIDSLRALGTEGESPRFELATPAMRPRLRLAAGSRYPVATRDQSVAVATIEPESLQPSGRGVAIPARQAMAMAAGASTSGNGSGVQAPVPGPAGLVPLASAKPNEPAPLPPPSTQCPNLPQPLRTEPMRPASHLEPLDAKPVLDFMTVAPAPALEEKKVEEKKAEEWKQDAGSAVNVAPPPPADDLTAATAWMHMAGFWKHAPRDLKLLVFGIPILLALALHPSIKKIPYTAPQQATGMQRDLQRNLQSGERNFQSRLNDQWVTVRQTMVERAAIALDEDFRAGLDDWTSRGGTTEWTFDATGFVRPGPLALYRPSVDLTDYQLQFLGMIDKKALSWVVRAADFDDYYVVKLVVLKPGPVPTVGVTRYAVIHGVAQDRADTTVFINAREDMLYRVRMDIHGDVFALTVQGQLVDSWSEPRLRKGGIGFFTARGEASRLRWVQVTHQYDMLGRLCAYLAPYNIPSTNGGWQP